MQILLQLGVLLGHLLVLGLPLITLRLEGLHLALVVAGLDIGLAEPMEPGLLAMSVDGQCEEHIINMDRTSRLSPGESCRSPRPPPRGAARAAGGPRSGCRAGHSGWRHPWHP